MYPNSRPSERDELQGFVGNPRLQKWWEKWGLQTRFHGKNPFQKPGILSMVVWFSMKLAMCKTCRWISMKLSMKLAIWKTCGWIRGVGNLEMCHCVSATIDGHFGICFRATELRKSLPCQVVVQLGSCQKACRTGWMKTLTKLYSSLVHFCIAPQQHGVHRQDHSNPSVVVSLMWVCISSFGRCHKSICYLVSQ